MNVSTMNWNTSQSLWRLHGSVIRSLDDAQTYVRLDELAEAAYVARCGGGVWGWGELSLTAKAVWIRVAQAVVNELEVEL